MGTDRGEGAHISSIDGGRPPQSEPSVGDLVEARALGIGQFLVLHGLLKATGLLPEETLPSWEIGAFEESVLQDALHPTQGLDHVSAVVVQVPQLPIVTLVGPPEWVLLQHLRKEGEGEEGVD